MNLKTRLSSWATWVSIFGALGVIFNAIGLFEAWGLTNESYQNIITAIGALLTAFGILNNPTDKKSF